MDTRKELLAAYDENRKRLILIRQQIADLQEAEQILAEKHSAIEQQLFPVNVQRWIDTKSPNTKCAKCGEKTDYLLYKDGKMTPRCKPACHSGTIGIPRDLARMLMEAIENDEA